MPPTRSTSAFAVCTLSAVLAVAAPSGAQIYKWTDEKGTVHFSNDPPPQASVEVIPEGERRPLVRNGPPPPGEAAAAPADDESPRAPRHRVAAEPVPQDVESGEILVEDEADVIIVDDDQRDLVTRYRANSPRNRPGQPIRQPRRAR